MGGEKGRWCALVYLLNDIAIPCGLSNAKYGL